MATSSPKRKAVFDVTQAEKEFTDSDRPEPFTVKLKSGDIVTFADPAALPWQEAASLTTLEPYLFLRTVLQGDEDYASFIADSFPQIVIKKMMDAYRDHYALDLDQGN